MDTVEELLSEEAFERIFSRAADITEGNEVSRHVYKQLHDCSQTGQRYQNLECLKSMELQDYNLLTPSKTDFTLAAFQRLNNNRGHFFHLAKLKS